MSLIKRAELFATAAHNGAKHCRKVSGDPYIDHPRAVAAKTAYFMERLDVQWTTECQESAIAVAWLHDTVEDTGIEMSDIEAFFEQTVWIGVAFMTDEKDPKKSRSERNAAYNEQLNRAPEWVQVVKLADIDANFEDIVASHRNTDPKLQFTNFERFIREKREIIVNFLTKVNETDVAVRILEKFDAFLALKMSLASEK